MNRRCGLGYGNPRIDPSTANILLAIWEYLEDADLDDPICLGICARRLEVDDGEWPAQNQVL